MERKEIEEEIKFCEICELNIPDQEKYRLDAVARKLFTKKLDENNFGEVDYGQYFEDFYLLEKAGTMERIINFLCPECGKICRTMLEADLSKYKRVWELLETKDWSHERGEEYFELCGQGILYFPVCCTNPECAGRFHRTISDLEGFKACEKHVQVAYRFASPYSYIF